MVITLAGVLHRLIVVLVATIILLAKLMNVNVSAGSRLQLFDLC